LPVFAGAGYIALLRSFVATAEQQDDLFACQCVIHPVARANIDAEFPNSIATVFVIPEVPQLDSIDAPVDGDPGLQVAELSVPLQIDVSLLWGEVVANFVRA
jgi:hypothetical protein